MNPVMPNDMMSEAIDAAFGGVIRDALQPVVERLTDTLAQVAALTAQVEALQASQAELLLMVERAKAGNWMVAKLLGG
jgi:hypothetical protein